MRGWMIQTNILISNIDALIVQSVLFSLLCDYLINKFNSVLQMKNIDVLNKYVKLEALDPWFRVLKI